VFDIRVSRVVSAPLPEAFGYVCDLENDPDWWTGVVAVRRTSRATRGAGATYWQRNRLLGLRFPMDIEITEWDEGRRMSFRSVSRTLAPFEATYLFEPVPGGTRVTMLGRAGAEGRLFRLLGALFRRYLRRLAETNFDNLKRVLDARGRAGGGSPHIPEPSTRTTS
jgi:hypothetical protein